MSYQGGNPGGHDDGHNLQQYPPSTYHMPPPRDYDSDDDQERVPLNTGQAGGPFQAPFDDPMSRSTTPGGSQRPNTGYSLSESYAGPPGAGAEGPGYPQGGDPNVNFNNRAPSPYARSDTSSTEAWRQRQAPTGMRRYATRKIKLQQGQVLAIDYPVPSAIQNAVQAKYRQPDVEGGSEEFTHMRCKFWLIGAEDEKEENIAKN